MLSKIIRSLLSLKGESKMTADRTRVGADDIVAGIEMILGRTPDSPLVNYHVNLGFADRAELGNYLINTDEFKSRSVPKNVSRMKSNSYGVSADDIIASIEMILGRTPDPSLVEYHRGLGFADRFELGNYMLNTDEFRVRSSKNVSMTNENESMTNEWEARANRAAERKRRLRSFGPFAHGLLVRTKNGFFAVDAEDSSVGGDLLHTGSYNENELRIFETLVSKVGNVLVVGSHIGAHVVPLAKKCSRLIAVEANPRTYEYLQANLLLNECNNVISYNIAAGDRDEVIKFLLSRDNSGGSKRVPPIPRIHYLYDEPEIVEIRSICLDALIGPVEFDLVVMDIEGSEYFALNGMQSILSKAKALAVEFLPHHIMDVANVNAEAFMKPIITNFAWMYLENNNTLFQKHKIENKVAEMFNAGECHALIYFLKEVSPEWLATLNVEAPVLAD